MDNPYLDIVIYPEINDYREKFYGLTLRQWLFAILTVVTVVPLYLGSRKFIGEGNAQWLVIIVSTPIVFFGFIPVQGLDAEKIVLFWKRQYINFYKPIEYKTEKDIIDEKNMKSKKYKYLENGKVIKLTRAEKKERKAMIKMIKKEKKEKEVDIESDNQMSKKEKKAIKKQKKQQLKQEKMLMKAKKKFGISDDEIEIVKGYDSNSEVELVPPKVELDSQKDDSDFNKSKTNIKNIEILYGIDDTEASEVIIAEDDIEDTEASEVIIAEDDIEDTEASEAIITEYDIEEAEVSEAIITENNIEDTETSKTSETDIEESGKGGFDEAFYKFEMYEKFKKKKPNATIEEFEAFYKFQSKGGTH